MRRTPASLRNSFWRSALLIPLLLLSSLGNQHPAHADDHSETILEEDWRLLLMEGSPAGSMHSVIRLVIRDTLPVVITDEMTTLRMERFGQPTEAMFRYHSEETVTGDRLRFSVQIDVPGADSTLITAEVAGAELICTTTEGAQTFESRLPWTPELAAGMRFQSQFDRFDWQPGDAMTITVYSLLDGLSKSTFVAREATEVTLTDGSTRSVMHVERTNTTTAGETVVVDYFLSPIDGIVVERRNGVASELVTDAGMLTELVPTAAPEAAANGISAGQLIDEYWELARVNDSRLGHVHTTIREVERDGELTVVEESVGLLTTTRFGEDQELMIRSVSESAPDGQFLRLTETYAVEDEPETVLDALVVAEELVITVTTGDEVNEQRISWTEDLAAGMKFSATLETYSWLTDEEVVTTEYSFTNGVFSAKYINRGSVERTLFDGSTQQLLFVEKQDTLADGTVATTHHFIDPGVGTIAMDLIDAGITIERAPHDVATDVNGEVHETGTVIEVSLPSQMSPQDFYSASEVVYVLTLPGLEAGRLASDQRQSVEQTAADVVEVRTSSVPHSEEAADPAEVAVCLAGGDYIDVADPQLQALATEGVLGAVTPLDKALALEMFVGEYVVDDYRHVFDNASQVAANRAGDCTEHSVLLVALLRLNGIPARSVAGLVVDSQTHQAMGHMWVEACIDGYWMPFDAVGMQGGISPAYIKFADWDLLESEASAAKFVEAVSIWQTPLKIEVQDFLMQE